MIHITAVELEKYSDPKNYQSMGNGVYEDLLQGEYVTTLRFELEEGEDSQYPLEDILDEFMVYCTHHIIETNDNGKRFLEAEIADESHYPESLESLNKVASLAGKHVYNKQVGDSIHLIIE